MGREKSTGPRAGVGGRKTDASKSWMASSSIAGWFGAAAVTVSTVLSGAAGPSSEGIPEAPAPAANPTPPPAVSPPLYVAGGGLNLGRASVVNGSSSDDELGCLHSSTKRQKAVPAVSTTEKDVRRIEDTRIEDTQIEDTQRVAPVSDTGHDSSSDESGDEDESMQTDPAAQSPLDAVAEADSEPPQKACARGLHSPSTDPRAHVIHLQTLVLQDPAAHRLD